MNVMVGGRLYNRSFVLEPEGNGGSGKVDVFAKSFFEEFSEVILDKQGVIAEEDEDGPVCVDLGHVFYFELATGPGGWVAECHGFFEEAVEL